MPTAYPFPPKAARITHSRICPIRYTDLIIIGIIGAIAFGIIPVRLEPA